MNGIWKQLRERYKAPEYAIFFEVANGTGSKTRRYADAIAMSLFPSRGLDVFGFEVKISRSDWLRELKKPEKAEEIASFCDYWYVVVPEKVVELSEVPRNWGLLVSKDGVLKQVKKPERLEPKDLDRPFLAAILRRADEWATHIATDSDTLRHAREQGYKEGQEYEKCNRDYQMMDYERQIKAIKEFEKVSGLQITEWNAGDVGEAVKDLLKLKHLPELHCQYTNRLERMIEELERVTKFIRERITIVERLKEWEAK